MEINLELFGQFIWFIKERESIREKKEAGYPWPWTKDPILQKYKFCNVWRQDDKTTRYIAQRAKEIHNWKNVILWFVWARIINRENTLKHTLAPTFLNLENWHAAVKDEKIIYNDAYIVLPHIKVGTRKIDSIFTILQLIQNNFAKFPEFPEDNVDGPSSRDVQTKILYNIPRIKNLILYEIMCDFWQRYGISEDYCNIGGGAMPMLNMLFPKETKFGETHIQHLVDFVHKKLLNFRHPSWGEFTMRCAEGVLCEMRKFHNLKNNPSARKRYYSPH